MKNNIIDFNKKKKEKEFNKLKNSYNNNNYNDEFYERNLLKTRREKVKKYVDLMLFTCLILLIIVLLKIIG